MRYLLDSTVLIDHLNGSAHATRWLSALPDGNAVISVIARAEVLVRARASHEAVKVLLDEYLCLPIDVEIADRAAAFRQQWKWKLPDAFQAAIAEHYALVLATRDQRDFGKASALQVKIPYRL
jgi:predicted nucleic acid-binding protein